MAQVSKPAIQQAWKPALRGSAKMRPDAGGCADSHCLMADGFAIFLATRLSLSLGS